MIRQRLPRQGRHRPPAGFTLTELMVIIAIIGILSGITISNSLSTWRDAQVSDLALQLAGWLEQVSRSPESSGGSCTVTFANGITGGITLNNGAQLASVSPASCSPQPSFTVPTRFGNQQIAAGASAASVVFTPRNAITASTDIQVRLALLNQAPVRCVRLSAVLGLIRLGRNDASSSATTACPDASFETI
ncbi:prepilin-type N-terminal cleavage/methylation domain-containing protein [Cyanobium sp. FGCU-6]|nr:prepilin-type N-terminal cleavage/methylation domain-containing protein [Cyanobium sp. FGCU6]